MDKKDKYQRFYESYEWRKARYDALKASDGKCQLCGRSKHDGVVLNVDHIVPLRVDWSQRVSLSNLQVLCHECNHGKGNRDRTDWRSDTPKIRRTKAEKRRARKARKKKRENKKARKKEKFIPGTFGPASGVRAVSVDDWIAEQVKRATGKGPAMPEGD